VYDGSWPEWGCWSKRHEEGDMATLIKITQDGRRLEVVGQVICLDGQLETDSLIEVQTHPLRRKILGILPEATHVAGRVALTRAEAEIAQTALKEAEAAVIANPAAVAERFRLAAFWKAREQGIE
jgi:hypothetical protein